MIYNTQKPKGQGDYKSKPKGDYKSKKPFKNQNFKATKLSIKVKKNFKTKNLVLTKHLIPSLPHKYHLLLYSIDLLQLLINYLQNLS